MSRLKADAGANAAALLMLLCLYEVCVQNERIRIWSGGWLNRERCDEHTVFYTSGLVRTLLRI